VFTKRGQAHLGFIQGWMPNTLFLVMFGLAIDCEVFIVSRIREEYERTGNSVDAIAGTRSNRRCCDIRGGDHGGDSRVFCLNRIPEMKQMGFDLAARCRLMRRWFAQRSCQRS
jgi:putative drug exporter of the RND superfamily